MSSFMSTALIPYNSRGSALIPYTPYKTPMEFIRYELIRNGTLKLVIPPSFTDLITSNFEALRKYFAKYNDNLSLSNNANVDMLHQFSYIDYKAYFSSDSIPPSAILNGDEIAEILQSQAGFTLATDKKPIVATYGCGPCIALGGYDPTNKIAFLVHFATAKEVNECSGMIFWHMSQLAKEKYEQPIQLHLRGGYMLYESSQKTIEAIRQWMTRRPDIPMKIASEDILSCAHGDKSLLIDSRTGSVSEYDPNCNPKSRDITELDMNFALDSAYIPNIDLAYIPDGLG